MMQKRGDNIIANATPFLARTTTSGAQSAVSSSPSPSVAVGTSSSADRKKQCASSAPHTLGAAASPRVSSADASAMLVTAIAQYVQHRLTVPAAIDDAAVDELHSIEKSGARKKLSSPSTSGAACSTALQRVGDSDGDVNAVHLVACTQQVEAYLLRCLLHVELTPGRLPNQPEVIGEALGAPSAATAVGTMEASPQVHRAARRVVTTTSQAASAEDEQSPPPRHPAASIVGDKNSWRGNTEARSRSQRSSVSAAAEASSSPRVRTSSGGTKAKELYYTYTNQGMPPPQPRPRGGNPAAVASTPPTRLPSRSNSAAAIDTTKNAAVTLPPPADNSEGAPPAHARGRSAFPCTRGGAVRPLHPTEIRAALCSWPSRIAQYVLATTFAEQELRSAAADAGGGADVDAPAAHGAARSDAPASHAHEEGSASATASSRVAEGVEDEAGVVIDVLLRRLCDMLQHTRLAADMGDAGAGQPPSIDFPSFARFYLADGDAGNIVSDSDTDEHAPRQRFGKGGDVHLYIMQLAQVLLSVLTPGGAGASGFARQDEVDSMGGLALSGDIATDIGMLLKHTPLITAPRHPSELPARTPALGIADINAATPLVTARGALWRALRSLLNFSPSSSHNPTMCTTPLVVGLVRRYTSGRSDGSSSGSGGGGDGLRVRFLPVADLIRPAGVTTTAAAAPASDDGLRDRQDAAHDPLRTPIFYTAVFLEVAGEDVLHSTANHEDAVTLEEESTSKVRYEADVPEVYRDRHRRRMEAQNRRGVHYSSSATHGGGVVRGGRSNVNGDAGAPASATNGLEDATALSARDRCLSRRECALWEKLLALAHFVHVSGTPAEVETTARYVTLVIRRRRGARQQSQRNPLQASSANATPVSIAESAALPSVPAFFFTLTETSALRSAAAAAAEARQALFCNDQDDSDDHDVVPFDALQGALRETGSASSTAAAAGRSNFFGSSGRGLRALLGWGKGAATAPPDQPVSPSSSLRDRNTDSGIRARPRREAGGPPCRAPPAEPPPPAVQDESTEVLIIDWMHDALIPLFFETTVSGSVAPHQGSAAPAKPSEGNEHDDSHDDESAVAATAGRRRAPYHLRSQRVLLGRVQAVTPSMVYGSFITTASSATVALACDMDAVMEAVVRDGMFDANLLPYLLLNQLFFATDGSSADAAHDTFNSPPSRARSAPVPERTPEHPRSAAAEQQSSQQAAIQSHGLRPIYSLPTSATTAASAHSPNAHARRVSFLENASISTPLRLDTRLPVAEGGAGSPLLRQSPNTPSAISPERSSSIAGSPRSILKSGRRYKREKLIRSSAPAASVVPFRSLFLWRLLAAEVLGSGDRAHGASKQEQQQQSLGNISAVSTTLCTTSAAYLRYTQALAVRVASDVATGILLAGLLAEQYACYRQLRGHDDQTRRDDSSAVTERDHSSTHRGAAGSEKEHHSSDTPAEVNAEAARWGALRCDDLLPLANSAALAFARAALAPMLCYDDDAPAHLAGVITEVKSGVDFSDACDEDECKRERRDNPGSDQSSASATSYVDGHRGQRDVSNDGATPHHRRASAPPIISLLSPSLPADVLNRLQTLSVVCLLHIRQEVLESITRPLDVVMRRLTWALARLHLHALCRPLDDFLRRGSAQGVHTEHQFWQVVREVLDMYGECLMLPHLLADAGAPLLASEAAVNRHEGGSKTNARAHEEEPSGVSSEEGNVISPLTQHQASATPLSFTAAVPLTTRIGMAIPKLRLSREQQDHHHHHQQQQQQPVVRSSRRGGVGFVPLSFINASFDPAHSSSLLPAQRTVLQPTPSRWSVTRALGGWNPHSVDPDDSYDLQSFAFDGRAMRLTSDAAQGAGCRSSSSAVNSATNDFVKAATSALGLQRSPPFVSLCTHGTMTGSQARVPLEAGTGTDMATTAPVLGNRFSGSRTSGNANSMVASNSRLCQLVSKHGFEAALELHHGCAGDASCDVDAALPLLLLHTPPRAMEVPAVAAPDTAESRNLGRSPSGIFDFIAVATPHCVATAAGSAAGGYEGSPLCAISSGSDASQRRVQQAQVSSHGSSFLTPTFAVPLLRRLQTVSTKSARDGKDAEEGEEGQPRQSPRTTQQQPQRMAHQGHTPLVGARESGDAVTGAPARPAGASPLSPEGGAEVAAMASGTSVKRLVVHVGRGVAVESPLLSPFVTEAKRMMVETLLLRWVLPWWAQRTLNMEQEVPMMRGKGSDDAHAGGATATDGEAAPNWPAQPLMQRGCSVSPPTTRSTVSTAPAASYERRDGSARASAAAASQLTKQMAALQRENAELHGRLCSTQRLLADIHQTCSGLRMAARQYEQAVALQKEERAPTAAASTTAVTDSSLSLADGTDTLASPQQLDLISPSPLSSTPQVVPGKGDVGVGSPRDDATPEKMMATDSAASPLESFSVTLPLADSVPPQLLYFAQTEEGRERVAELCQRIIVLLSGAANVDDNKDNAKSSPPSVIAYGSDLPSRLPSSTSHSFLLHSLSQGMQGSPCLSSPETTSVELAATAVLCSDCSVRRRHSVVSHGPSQLFSPLQPQSFRRTSTALTLMSLAPAGALAMSNTIAAETPCSTPTPIAVLILGASSDPSTGSSPARLSRQSSWQQQHMRPLPPSSPSAQSSPPSVASQHVAGPAFSSADVDVQRTILSAYPTAAPSHVSPVPLTPKGASPLPRRAPLWNQATPVTPVRHTPPQLRIGSADDVEPDAHTSDEQQHSRTSCFAAPSAGSVGLHDTQVGTPYHDLHQHHGRHGENGNGNRDDRQAPPSTLSSPSVHSSNFARQTSSVLESRGSDVLSSPMPPPLSPPSPSSSKMFSEASSEPPFEVNSRSYENGSAVTTTIVHTDTQHAVLIREDDSDMQDSAAAASAAGSDGGFEAPKDDEGDVVGAVAMAVGGAKLTEKHVEVAEDASCTDHEDNLSEQPAVLQQTVEAPDLQPSLCDISLPLPRVLLAAPLPQPSCRRSPASLGFRRSPEGTLSTSPVTRRVSAGTPSSSIFSSSSPSPPTVQCTNSDVTTNGERHVAASDDETEHASHESDGASCCDGVLPVQRAIANDADEACDAAGQEPISTKAAVLPTCRPSLSTREDANGSSPASASSTGREQAALHALTAATVSSSPWRERAPVRNSEAAVTALADLQQRLSGSNSAVVELRQQLQQVEQELREKAKAMTCLTEQLTATEAALGAAWYAATVAEEKAQQQQQRLSTPSPPPPPRASVATSTENLLLSPSAFSTLSDNERANKVDSRSVASTPAAATVETVVGESKAAAAPAASIPAATPPPSSADSSPPALRAQPLCRVHELEDELRNANFRMDQWRALLDAERHAHMVQVDQLTRRLESEQRRSARASRSRSRSLSPLVSGAGPLPCAERSARDEARAAQPPAPPPSLESFPPPAAEVPRSSLTTGDGELPPASPREQQRINTLMEQLHVVEARAAEERTQRVAAEDGIRVLERERRVIREQLEALENERAIAQVQQRQKEHDSDQREAALRRELESHVQTLTAMHAAQAGSEELQRHLKGELDVERRARAAAADSAAAHMATRDRLMRDGEEAQQQLRCERDRALQREKEALAHAAAEAQAAQLQIAALRQRVESTTDQLRTAEADSREHRHRCIVAETLAAARESAQKALEDRVMVLEEELSSARAARKQWQQDTDERERALRHQYEEAAASASAAMEAQRRANSEQLQRSEDALHAMQRAQAVRDEGHRTAFEDVTRKLADAEQAAHLALDDLYRERETRERTAAALQEAQSEKEELHRRFEAVLEKLHLAELDADEHSRQRDCIEALKLELEAARTQQQEAAAKAEDAFRREVETHMRTIAALQEGRSAHDELRRRLEEELQSEKLARAADTAAHKAALVSAQGQVSQAEQRAQDIADALRREEEAHARTLAAMQAAEEANRQLRRARAAQETHAQQRARSWLSAREACLLKWIEAKTLLMVDAWGIVGAERQPQQTPSLASPSPTAAGTPPARLERTSERRSRGRGKRHGRPPPAPDAVAPVQAARAGPRAQPEMVVVSVDDPLGLRYELQCKARHIASLEERVHQLEEVHAVDQQVVSTLQKLVAQEEMRNGNGIAAAARLPPPPPPLPMTTASWSSRSPLRTPSRAWPARDPTLMEGHRSPTALLWDPHPGSHSSATSPPGTTERKRLAPNEYRQRYTSL
ncbi:conserved hypothetical protein [Leishmania major strain Friedlin]|uniref:Uncharacterized protein n=1 Tax=Leishmania major TaxID=5664 RepID=Q4QFQ4_LEIMA|nr:conserved hypothetical protein [Leishmania major strain Friedlin]CAG9571268.1 hypothetical_protein_-_conserved [Leishmania major strain Friedlin]CAJ03051.1 conserved hypothetical protein [Leishmania major strain Friedlin]|eukprot:XP_001687680.1 conserved hypothetical protein [Leishmania major strain Friedlin]